MHTFSKFLSISILAAFITGCIPVAIVGAGAAAGTMLGRDSRSLQTISDDTDIQFQVDQALRKDKAIHEQANISNITFNHIVLLVGEAPSERLKMQAEQLTLKVPKVRRVYNQIQVAPNIGAIQFASDATISANLQTRLAMTSNVDSNDFKYIVENKVVYLMGLSTQEQVQRVTQVIRNSSGVGKLVTLVEIQANSNTNANSSSADSSSTPSQSTSSSNDSGSASSSTAPAVTTGAVANSDVSFQPVNSATP